MKEYRWKIKSIPDANKVENLQNALKVSKFVCELLIQRGFDTYDKCKRFFRPNLEDLYDPFLMKDMEKAVLRLGKAIEKGEKILVYGDYDVDGTTSVAMMYLFIQSRYSNVDYYIPDRNTEGYGVSTQGINYAKENGFSLIISLDCGIRSVDKIEYANKLGIDFIICDHHLPGDEVPKAVAVLDPKQPSCNYPYKELSGCGVGFKLIQAYALNYNINQHEVFKYIDFVAISIASDIVQITDENRILAYHGIKLMNDKPRVWIDVLQKISKYSTEINVSQIVFGFAPRINAAGRIDHAKKAVQLLISKTECEAQEIFSQINSNNEIRRNFDKNITKDAIEMIESDEVLINSKSTVLYKKDWHKGVVGIVASRCIEHYYRPTIILTESNGKITGSARSVSDFDIHEAISQCSNLLEQFGGHAAAAGLTMIPEKLEEFQIEFEKVVSENIKEHQLIPYIDIDLELELKNITINFYNIINQFEPLGPGNMTPVFVSKNVYCVNEPIILSEKHLKMFIQQDDSIVLEVIGFNFAAYSEFITKKPFDITYTIDLNEYKGEKRLQIKLKDLKFKK